MRLAVLLIPGCRTAERVSYSHAPTADLLQTYDVSAPTVVPFAAAGVTIAPFVIPLDYTTTAIKLAVLAPTATTLTVHEATLSGTSGPPRTLATDVPIVVDAPAARPPLLQRDVTLGQLPTTELDVLGQNGLVLTLAVVGADGAPSTLTYTIDRHVETYLVTR